MSFVRSQNFLIKLLKLHGFFSFNLGNHERSKILIIYSLIFNFIAISSFLFSIMNLKEILPGMSGVVLIFNVIQNVVSILNFSMLIVHSLFYQKKFSKIIKNFQETESILNSQSISSKKLQSNFYNKLTRKSIILSSMILFIISFTTAYILIYMRDIIAGLYYKHFVISFLSYAIPLLYSKLVLAFLYMILKTINQFLGLTHREYELRRFKKQKILEKIDGVKILTHSFCEDFGLLIIINFLYILTQITFEIFGYIRIYYFERATIPNIEVFHVFFFNAILMFLPHILLFIIIAHESAKVEKSYQKCFESIKNRSHLDSFQMICIDEEDLKINANGFFYVNDQLSFGVRTFQFQSDVII